MITNKNNVYRNIQVKLYNNAYTNCLFEGCTMEYSGTRPVSMSGCSFNNVKWVFSGPAQNTLQFMRALYHGMDDGGKKLIEQTFDNIRTPP